MTINGLGHLGDGLAQIDTGAVYVPRAAPGDLLTIKATGSRGEIVAVEQPSEYRVKPPCPIYGACGGCALQHLSSEFSEQWKIQQLETTLSMAGLGAGAVATVYNVPVGCRRRATFNFRQHANGTELGFKARRSHKIVDVKECLLLTPKLNASIASLAKLLGECLPEGGQGTALTTHCSNGIAVDLDMVHQRGRAIVENMFPTLAGKAREHSFDRISVNGELAFERHPLKLDYDGLDVAFPIGGFLQPSKEGEVALRAIVAGEIESRVRPKSKIVDLFAGTGALSLPLARSYTLLAFEGMQAAVDAMSAAARNSVGLKPVSAATRDLNQRPLVAAELKGVDVVIMDPPRAGAAEQVGHLAQSRVPLIVYVSCNIATFARDCRILVDAGFMLEKITPVDQFNHSPHLECVGVLTRGQ